MSAGQIQVRTLRQFLESEQKIDCDCSNYWVCTRSGPLKLDLAIQRLGWEFDFYAGRELLARVVYCSVCFNYGPTFRLGWEARPKTYAGSHGAGMDTLRVADAAVRELAREEWPEPQDWLKGGESVRKFGPGR
jgi:hypothetical protein